MTDVWLYQTTDGGELQFGNGQVTLADGLSTAVFLSMFGGNERDEGLESERRFTWWGNCEEPDAVKHYRSETQYLLRTLPAVPGNLNRIRDAALRDLAWLTDETAEAVDVAIAMPTRNRIEIKVAVTINGETSTFAFAPPWQQR